jgi:hypothetical protein
MGQTKQHFEILNADEAAVIPDWYSTQNASKAVFAITITGSITVTLNLDPTGDGTKNIVLGSFTSSCVKLLNSPIGKVQAVSSAADPGSSAIVDLYLVNN